MSETLPAPAPTKELSVENAPVEPKAIDLSAGQFKVKDIRLALKVQSGLNADGSFKLKGRELTLAVDAEVAKRQIVAVAGIDYARTRLGFQVTRYSLNKAGTGLQVTYTAPKTQADPFAVVAKASGLTVAELMKRLAEKALPAS